jgi:hypothetical protein
MLLANRAAAVGKKFVAADGDRVSDAILHLEADRDRGTRCRSPHNADLRAASI